jgi:hypothetical protein
MYRKQVFHWENQQLTPKTRLIRLAAPVLAVAGLLGMSVPSAAVTTTYDNDYRACAGRLLSVGLTPDAASQACATALRPRDLSLCVADINKRTQINALDALAVCRQARRPKELATCVVAISKDTQGADNIAVLNYCGRSLLPVRFAQCVVGLRKEIDLAPTQLLDTCIDGGDRISGLTPASTLPTQPSSEFSPTFETQPVPANPNSK